MKKISIYLLFSLVLAISLNAGHTFAETSKLIQINANQAFDAVQTQKDPANGASKKIALVDVRTRAEYFWVGTASQVDEIIMKDDSVITPDLGKAVLIKNGRYIRFQLHNSHNILPISKIKEVKLSPIAINIPFKLWDEATASMNDNADFRKEVEALALENGVDIVIFFCRSGGRSEACLNAFDTSLFERIYEIDQPDGENGFGGFEGTSYSNAFIGYRGFPRRDTTDRNHTSVSWKDSSLPIKTSVNPLEQHLRP